MMQNTDKPAAGSSRQHAGSNSTAGSDNTTALPPVGTQPGSEHILTYDGCDAAGRRFFWNGEGWATARVKSSYFTKASRMYAIGWRYVRPYQETADAQT